MITYVKGTSPSEFRGLSTDDKSTIEIPGNGDGTKVLEYRFPVRKIAGIHALWLRFYGDNNQIFCVDSFHFEK